MSESPRARVLLYTTSWCGQCTAAKDLLRRRGIAFEEIDAEALWGAAFRDEIFKLTGRTTVPQVVIDGQPVGGHADLVRHDESGKLRELLGMG
jgi:glutaredoxin 3